MNFLALKIHPPVVFLFFVGLAWCISNATVDIEVGHVVRIMLTACLVFIAISIGASAVLAFRQSQTTVNPTRPNLTTEIVVTGIYRYTRNPMYLGLAILLIAWSVFLSNLFSMVCSLFFIVYITRFQIKPEEVILSEKFGKKYNQYQSRVRRWL